jgi:hypothetical protein
LYIFQRLSYAPVYFSNKLEHAVLLTYSSILLIEPPTNGTHSQIISW